MAACPTCTAENAEHASVCRACGVPLDNPIAGLIGTVFAGRYEILTALGRGGMGMVYKARDNSLGDLVAIKIVRPDLARSPDVARRFHSEIRLARRVRHRNVCGVFGDGEDQGLLYVVMEYIEGSDLRHLQAGAFEPARALDATLQVAEGLAAIHDAGIVHRDLKTANIMVDRSGVVRVMDFGIAKPTTGEAWHTATQTGAIVGTPDYMSPEQIRGEVVDHRSDLYSLGVVAFELFTGRLPFRGDTPVATIVKHLNDPPPLDGPEAEPLSPALRGVLRRALAKTPSDRYTSAREMGEALRTAAGDVSGIGTIAAPVPGDSQSATTGHTIHTQTQTMPGTLPGPVIAARRTRRSQLVLAALAVALAGAALTPALWRWRSPALTTANPRVYLNLVPEVDKEARHLTGTSSQYPEYAPKLEPGQEVSLVATFVVTEKGEVTDISIEEGGALEGVFIAISRWKYEPALKDGLPVRVRIRYKRTFVAGFANPSQIEDLRRAIELRQLTGAQASHVTALCGELQNKDERYHKAAALALKALTAEYDLDESTVNRVGYAFLEAGDTKSAIALLERNAGRFPQSWNAHDSLGEVYERSGQRDLARASYLRSLALNPANDGASKALQRLGQRPAAR